MTMMNLKRKIAAVLAAVTLMTIGANAAMAEYGDADNDTGAEPRYKVGQQVEVYHTALHWHTKTYKVISSKKDSKGRWTYTVNKPGVSHGVCPLSTSSTVNADDIEAPK